MTYIILAIIVLLLLWLIGTYNRFVTLINRAKEAWADIDVQLKRRYDLIPNLVNTVRGMLAGALKSVFAIAEAYPDLKANQNFLELQRELSDTENKIQAARRFYNTTVRDLNILIERFPSNLIANMGHFEKRDFFELPEGSAEANPVEVKF
jgi:LemA protein